MFSVIIFGQYRSLVDESPLIVIITIMMILPYDRAQVPHSLHSWAAPGM